MIGVSSPDTSNPQWFIMFLRFPFLALTAELSGGTNMREAQLPVQAKCRPSSAICWRRANQRARQLFLYDAIATDINGHCVKTEPKSGS